MAAAVYLVAGALLVTAILKYVTRDSARMQAEPEARPAGSFPV